MHDASLIVFIGSSPALNSLVQGIQCASPPVHQCTNAQFARIIINKPPVGLYAECASAKVHKCNKAAVRHCSRNFAPRHRRTLHQCAGVTVCQCNNAPVYRCKSASGRL